MRKQTILTALFAVWAQVATSQTIVDVASGDDRFETLVEAVGLAGLVDALNGEGPLTVFGPVNSAFDDVPAKFLEPDWVTHLTNILLYHVVSGNVSAADLELDEEYETLYTEDITVTELTEELVQINEATVSQADIFASNGVIHAIEEVLLPSFATRTIVDILTESGDFEQLLNLVTLAGLTDAFAGEGPLTVFAPTNAAITAIPPEDRNALASDPEALAELLGYHVVQQNVLSAELAEGATVTTQSGGVLTVTSVAPEVVINDSTVTEADLLASNGVIHVIDAVLLPPQDDTAPPSTDGDILQPSVQPTSVTVEDTLLPSAEPSASIVEDTLPPSTAGDTPVPLQPSAVPTSADTDAGPGETPTVTQPEGDTVVDLAVADPDNFSILVQALTVAGLVETLSGEGPFTVFAPVNEAFQNVSSKYLEDDDWLAHLQDLLLYHVVSGNVLAADLEVDTPYTTLNEEDIIVTEITPELVEINEVVDVIQADVIASNGVIHAIDLLLLPTSATSSIVDIAVASPGFSILVSLLTNASLVETLQGDGPFTVFAPTDAAFEALGEETLASLTDPASSETLINILTYHVVAGTILLSSELAEGATVEAVNQDTLTVTSVGNVTINDVPVSLADLLASNGVIHVIDEVLLPPETPSRGPSSSTSGEDANTVVDVIADDERFQTLEDAVIAADLVTALSEGDSFTVFAPNNEAFAAIDEKYIDEEWVAHLTDILQYHVVDEVILAGDLVLDATYETLNGESIAVQSIARSVIISGATVTDIDINASNGVIHEVDAVMLPPSATNSIMDALGGNVTIDVFFGDSDFSTLVQLLTNADLVDTLRGPGPFTLFAPSNQAFDDLESNIAPNRETPNDDLTALLTYHVLEGIYLSSSFSEGDTVTTLNEETIEVTSDSPVTLNEFSIVMAGDILVNNGVIHVIDVVLVPESLDSSGALAFSVALASALCIMSLFML